MKVVVTPTSFAKFSTDAIDILGKQNIRVYLNDLKRQFSVKELKELLTDADGIILGNETLNQELLCFAPKLKVIAKYGVGLNNIDLKYCLEKNIRVIPCKQANTQSVAEHAIALMFTLNHSLIESNNYCHQNKFNKIIRNDMSSKTVGIVGYGAIGQRVSQLLSAFNCNIVVYAKTDQSIDSKFERVELQELFRISDIITIHLPLNSTTHSLINETLLNSMKENSILINTARAEIIEKRGFEQVVINRSDIKWGIDVYYDEPQIDSFLINKSNVLLTSHQAASSIDSINNMSVQSAENILKVLINE